MYKTLSKHKIGSASFDKAWKNLAKNKDFGSLQHNFIRKEFYTPVVNRAKKELGINIAGAPLAMQNVIWSTAVQHGVGGAMTILKRAGIKKGVSYESAINKIYNERSKVGTYFKSSSKAVQKSVKNRFANERKDALAALRAGGGRDNRGGSVSTKGMPSKAVKNVKVTHAAVNAYHKATSMGLRLTSSYRSPSHNKKVGGSKTSKHMAGTAYDFAGSKKQMDAFAKWARNSGMFGQVLWQVKGHYDHVHVSW